MKDDGAPHPVELLRDQHGIYGIGVSELFDFEVVAWSCGVELDPFTFEGSPAALILRPDWFADNSPRGAVLQKIAGGFRRGPFMRSHEERLRQFIHHEALNRNGLPWPPQHLSPGERAGVWWSTDKQQQARNRGIYHGLRQLSLHVVNHLIGAALETAADADAVKAARRFTFKHRESIYRAAALSRRALQLTETFPVLALAIYSEHWRARKYAEPPVEPYDNQTLFQSWDAETAELSSRKSEAVHLVDRGARLRPRGLFAGAARVGLDRRPQRADRLPLGCGRCRPLSHIRGGIGGTLARRDPILCQRECGSVATNNPYRADRIRECYRPGRGRLRREIGAPGRQRHWIYAVRIQPERKMARTTQRDCAQPDANCYPSRSCHSHRDRPVRRDPGHGVAVIRGGVEPNRRAQRRRDRAGHRCIRPRVRMAA